MRVELQAGQVDLSVLLLGASGRVDRDEDFIFYNNPSSGDGAISLTGGTVLVDTARLADEYERVVLVMSSGDAPLVQDAEAVLRQDGVGVDLRFRPVDTTQVAALVWGELYRRNGGWRFRAVGQGWADGLAGLARDYGVDVD